MQKENNFSEWYNEIIRKADIIDDRYPVKGMPVYKPYGYKIVLGILRTLESFLEEEGFESVWFPILIPYEIFSKESKHIKGFEEEVFWVLEENQKRLILRPTSETEMYYMFSLWVQSYQDLPIKYFMTNTVYRYETKATKPLIRGREILWNEAHTVHRTKEEAEEMIKKSMEIYSRLFWDVCSIPHIWVIRPQWDKFAGADYTIAADTVLPDGRFLQIGTTHMLGQNFAKAFEIKFMDKHPYVKVNENVYEAVSKDGNIKIRFDVLDSSIKYKIFEKGLVIKEGGYRLDEDIFSVFDKIIVKELGDNFLENLDRYKYVWQTCFGVSMRFAAAVISIHGDDKGLVLPFNIAPVQIVIVPIYYEDSQRDIVLEYSKEVYNVLKKEYRVYLDDRDDKTPGWKFNYWEFKGVPFRIEVGPRDVEKRQVVIAMRQRNSKAKKIIVDFNTLNSAIKQLIKEYDEYLKEEAKKYFEGKIVRVSSYDDLKKAISESKVVKAPFCMEEECAKKLKEKLHVEVRGTDLEPEEAKGRCIYCNRPAKYWAYMGKSY